MYVHEENVKQLHLLMELKKEKEKILIAEDNKVNLSIAKRFLTK